VDFRAVAWAARDGGGVGGAGGFADEDVSGLQGVKVPEEAADVAAAAVGWSLGDGTSIARPWASSQWKKKSSVATGGDDGAAEQGDEKKETLSLGA
jgi:hypothetical protein